jgi:tetratricopeptide (TPR) repeat protein
MLTVFPPFLESTQNLVRYLQNLKVRYDTLMIYSKANLAVTAKKYDEAEQLYIEAIGKGDQESLIGLGNLYLANKKYANANKLFLAIYALGDHSDNIFMQIAKAFESQKKYDEELDFFTNALAKDPLCLICHAFIGNALYFTKKYINAAKNYDLALENGYYFIISNYLDLNISTGAIDEAKNLAEELGKKGQKISAEDLARVYFEAQD